MVIFVRVFLFFFFFNDTATTEIYTLSLHDALPIGLRPASRAALAARRPARGDPRLPRGLEVAGDGPPGPAVAAARDRIGRRSALVPRRDRRRRRRPPGRRAAPPQRRREQRPASAGQLLGVARGDARRRRRRVGARPRALRRARLTPGVRRPRLRRDPRARRGAAPAEPR